jgi:ribosomal protein L31E
MSEDMLKHMSENMLIKISKKMSNNISKNMLNKIPKILSIIKYINIMVGIIQNKII